MDRPCVLVVDDNGGVREFLCALLEREGYRAESVGGAREALEFCGNRRPEMMMVDLHLSPEENGLAVLRRVKTTGKSFPVVVMSASTGRKLRLQAKEEGAEYYLEKPFRLASVREMLGRICPIK